MTAGVSGESNHGIAPRARTVFPRSARLVRHADFGRVYKLGRRHFSSSMTVFYLQRENAGATGGMRVGFTVGRALGGAVQRNRMKRRLREAVRLTFPPASAAVDVIINPKKGLLDVDFANLMNEMRRAFEVIEQKSGSKPPQKKIDIGSA